MRVSNTYPINEEQLKLALQGYEVEYCEKQWEILESEIADIKAQKSQLFNSFNPKLLIIPVAAIVLIVVLYYNLSNLFSTNNIPETQTLTTPVQQEVQQEPEPEKVQPEPKKVIDNTAALLATAQKQKADSAALAEKKLMDSKIKVVEVDSSKSIDKNVDENAKVIAEQSATEPKGEIVKKKKKKKKKKNSFESIESLRKSTLVPNDADNDVVVPD